MKPSPCIHPKYIKCRDGQFRTVPCGKCAACLVNKGLHRANRIKEYIKGYNCQFFITLTFEDKYLPLARYSDIDNCLYHDIDCDYNGEVYKYDLGRLDSKDCNILLDTIKKFSGIPVLSHHLLINFKKRLRYHLNKLKLDSYDFFLYGAGEYGPTTFRPHYHLIFGSKSFISTSIFEECVSQAWSFCTKTKSGRVYTSFGFTDVQRSFGQKSVDYIAKYLSCTTNLPCYLADAAWRPFAVGSTKCSEYLSRLSQANLRDVYDSPAHELRVLRNGKYVVEPVPACYKSRYFPFVSKFGDFARHELYSLYRVSFEYHSYRQFKNGFLARIPYSPLKSHNLPFRGENYSVRPLSLMQKCVEDCCFRQSNGIYIEDTFIQERNFMRLFYVSRTVCKNAASLGVSVEQYVDKIVDYYNSLELLKLRRFYEFQNELLDDILHPVDTDYLFTLYYHTDPSLVDLDYYQKEFAYDPSVTIHDSAQQKRYEFLSLGILRDSTKTKKRNDKFNSLGLVHRPYVSRISSNISKFLKL